MTRIALPTGDLRSDVAALLDTAGVGIRDYAAGSRALRFPFDDGGVARVFREKDIPVQVALGQYDLGICGATWIEELTRGYPNHDVVRLRDLGFGAGSLWLASAGDTCDPSLRFVSEYPNIAEVVARRMRLARYRVFPVLGAADAYPPEDADVVLIAARDEADVEARGLRPLWRVLDSSAWLIGNRRSLAAKDLRPADAPAARRPHARTSLDAERPAVAPAPPRRAGAPPCPAPRAARRSPAA